MPSALTETMRPKFEKTSSAVPPDGLECATDGKKRKDAIEIAASPASFRIIACLLLVGTVEMKHTVGEIDSHLANRPETSIQSAAKSNGFSEPIQHGLRVVKEATMSPRACLAERDVC